MVTIIDDFDVYDKQYTFFKNWWQTSIEPIKLELNALRLPLFSVLYVQLASKNSNNVAAFFDKHSADFSDPPARNLLSEIGVTSINEQGEKDSIFDLFKNDKISVPLSVEAQSLLLMFLTEHKMYKLLQVLTSRFSFAKETPEAVNSEKAAGFCFLSEKRLLNEIGGRCDELDLALNAANHCFDPAFAAEPGDARPPFLPTPEYASSRLRKITDGNRENRAAVSPGRPSTVCTFTVLNAPREAVRANVSRDAKYLSLSLRTSVVRVWDVEQRAARSLVGHGAAAFICRFFRFAPLLVSGAADAQIRLWNVADGSALCVYKGHAAPVVDVDVETSDNYFASCAMDRTAILWCTNRPRPLRLFGGASFEPTCVRFAANCNYVGAGGRDGKLRLFDVRSANCVRLFSSGGSCRMGRIGFSSDGLYAALAENGAIRVWDLRKAGAILRALDGRYGDVTSMDFSRGVGDKDGPPNVLLCGHKHNAVTLWDINDSTDEPMETYRTGDTLIDEVRFSDRNLVLVAGRKSIK